MFGQPLHKEVSVNTIWLLALLVLAPAPTPQAPAKTPSFYEITKDPRDIHDAAVPDASVKKYLAALDFPPANKATKKKIEICHKCGEFVALNIVAEMGSIAVDGADLSAEGRLMAKLRYDDWKIWLKQKDIGLSWLDRTAYLWVTKEKQAGSGLYQAAVLVIDDDGARSQTLATGTVRICKHSKPKEAGKAFWHSPHACEGRVQGLDFHLTQWVPCAQGCCVFTDDGK
jgi:hypothetical protein